MTAAMLVLAAIGTVQPCAPFSSTLEEFRFTPCGEAPTAAVFHSAAAAVNIDPRVMMAGAVVSGKHCLSICASLNNDPLGYCLMLGPWDSFAAGIQGHTQRIRDQYILNGYSYLEGIASAEGWDVGAAKVAFADLLGSPNAEVVPYTTSCCGDCNLSHSVTIDELILGVQIFLGNGVNPPIAVCPRVDADFNGVMFVTDLVRCQLSAICGCPAP